MSLEDPFFVVKGEVQKAVATAQGLYQRWGQLLQETQIVNKEELNWTTNELRNTLRSIEWDLEDLEETICIVESNPQKFTIAPSEVAARRSFVTEMRESVKVMQDHMLDPAAQSFVEKNNQELVDDSDRCGLLSAEKVSAAASHILEEQQLHQKLIIEEQDEQLELVSGSISVLKHMSGRVGEELDEQTIYWRQISLGPYFPNVEYVLWGTVPSLGSQIVFVIKKYFENPPKQSELLLAADFMPCDRVGGGGNKVLKL